MIYDFSQLCGLGIPAGLRRALFLLPMCQLGPLTWLYLAAGLLGAGGAHLCLGVVMWLAWASSQQSWLKMVVFLPWWLVPKSKIGIGQSSRRLSPKLAQGHATTVSWTKQVTQPALSWGRNNRSQLSCASGQEWQQPLLEMIAVLTYSPVSCPVISYDKHSCISYCQQHVVRQRRCPFLEGMEYECGQQATLT